MILDFSSESEQFATPFESWCAETGVHPDHYDAWRLYESSLEVAHPAAS